MTIGSMLPPIVRVLSVSWWEAHACLSPSAALRAKCSLRMLSAGILKWPSYRMNLLSAMIELFVYPKKPVANDVLKF